ncbi:archaeoflavoprotein AfpA [Methanobacterium alkalithermotolerans]|uniref:Archaeoflavoprotein AfpA n=1 Tax=Methanobacterium alkalithermotolerans TaxID=2731220 RepID=A0A8T8KAU6_9EURY|nr:archaeoflavoprotein AfpA [Methanobacterium alkalithermotolerans]QUH24223.1 archaeoflavoprotein AfpA [Methanobacterium alkalithermotolerans]
MKKEKKPKVAWGIAGAGEKMVETLEMMKKIKKEYEDVVDIDVYISRSGDQVIKYYGISNEIETNFNNIWVEINANSPFLAGQIQLGKYEFMLIAPCSANTVAKIALRMGDTLLANSAIMGQRADIPLYIMPSDYEVGVTITKLPDGKDLKLTLREEDVENINKLAAMDNTNVLKEPEDIKELFARYFK